MITLTFDKGRETERSLQLNSFYERPIRYEFNGSYSRVVSSSEDVPQDVLGGNMDFSTIEAVNGDGVTLPISGSYNKIVDYYRNYDDTSKIFSIRIVLGLVVAENGE